MRIKQINCKHVHFSAHTCLLLGMESLEKSLLGFKRIYKRTIFCIVGLLLIIVPGCTRNFYRNAADRAAYNIVGEKTCGRPWQVPARYSVNADPRSRLYDPSCPNDPKLPCPGPYLYNYQLPPLTENCETTPSDSHPRRPAPEQRADNGKTEQVVNAGFLDSVVQSAASSPKQEKTESVQMVSYLQQVDSDVTRQDATPATENSLEDLEEILTIQPIPASYWEALPAACLSRMLEFKSVREEYRRTFGEDPPATLRDTARRLTFCNIVELAYLNSREYQTQKETLYKSALALSLRRYDYMCKFTASGNSVAADYDHVRNNGATVDTLGVPTGLKAERMVALGGTFATRFANSVILTFNGPQGFAADISSNMLFEFTQSIFQRDVLLEPLIQSERNVIYAGRNFARYRKKFFLSLVQTYYSDLLSKYRGIEIDTQNYFATVRALAQAEAEVRSGIGSAPPRVQIDQIEQNMLNGRSRLISTCNNLETSLDRLKLTLGLPTETPINIDLQELNTLTRLNEIEVAGELIRRARERVEMQLGSEVPDREEIISAEIVLLERILAWQDLRMQIGQQDQGNDDLNVLRARLRVDEIYEAVDRTDRQLAGMKQSVPPMAPINVFRGTMNSVQTRLELVGRQLQLADELQQVTADHATVLGNFTSLKDRSAALRERVIQFLRGGNEDLSTLQGEAEAMLSALVALDAPARRIVHALPTRPAMQAELQQTMQEARQLLGTTDRLAADSLAGLVPVEMSADDAMVTALVQRFDLMNERGSLADNWRAIKLAADDLKSVLNLNVKQALSTGNNQPFGFDLNDSRTELRASLDLPLNRRQQRNRFRESLINYQAGRRKLMALEDNIKFEARQDLRKLDLDRVQYDISVVRAALASERVYSTQLELSLGLATVTARDFLEAQQAYRQSVSDVANGRLNYIVNRAQLAADMELMMLDDSGFWPELKNDNYQPSFDPIYPAGAGPTYGNLPRQVLPSRKIKRMLNYPQPGLPTFESRSSNTAVAPNDGEVIPAPMPTPIDVNRP